ncbi:undecaprenyl-phosphate glucose phosphotransferase [Ilyomonas limi]|uniref:Undecaprenyl-phosphate glucose phosphotransferase n=1 Tax=Ilyomonas limi TaxID=2575867 RepID=A0A4U3L8V1_9BACT|nr:undecaprenyl-phosphate glucose phosphotransferase [Ilyomonas limi]TKK70346.1 undecaprenyl-phosphate glucose phosphotransferase [Ilyomonas limi]
MSNRFPGLIRHAVLTLDVVFLNLLMLISWHTVESIDRFPVIKHGYFWMALNVSWLLIAWIGNLYHGKNIISFELLSRRTARIYLYWSALIIVSLFFVQFYQLPRIHIAIILGGYAMLLFINRLIYLGVYSHFKQSKSLMRHILILGFNDRAKQLATYFETEGMSAKVIGFCEAPENVRELSNYPILSSMDKAIELSKQYQVSDIYSTIAPEQNLDIYKIMEQADQECIHFRLIPDFSLFLRCSMHINYLGDIPVLTPRKEPLSDISSRIKKRAFDIVLSSLVIAVVMLWLTPLISLIILIESRGHVFFIQQRTGRNNKPFGCIKFRSMKVNKDADAKQATRDDDRITKVGRFLRATSLDELPQFFNVLRGEMSLVGPRPHMLKHTEDYSKLINKYMVRQFLKPGITGWAQVNGYRGETKTLEQMKGRVEHDIWYMENWSLWLDIRIIFQTIYITMKGDKNAY